MKAWCEIDCKAAEENVAKVRRKVGKSVSIMAVVKADAYSHGAAKIARSFIKGGARFLAVATAEEGIELRKSGIKSPVLVFNPLLPDEIPKILEYKLTPSTDSLVMCKYLEKKAQESGRKIKIHIEVDTGMGRSGIYPGEVLRAVTRIANLKNIIIEGIFTHFPSAESDRDFTGKQIDEFAIVLKQLEEAKIHIPFKHAANSAGVIAYPRSYFNMVRPGLCLYGISPSFERNIEMKPVLSLKAKLVNCRWVPGGKTISYGRTFVTKGKSYIANLTLGYVDGYDRRLSNKAEILVKGRRVPVVGTICMDRCLIDTTDIPDVQEGEEAVLIGNQMKETIYLEELARKADTIPHEFISRLGKRLPRIYIPHSDNKR